MSVTYYKGFVGKEDIEFGIGTFTRKDKNHTSRDLTQVNLSHIPRKIIIKTADFTITNDYVGEYTFSNVGALATVTFTLPPALAGLGPYKFFMATGSSSLFLIVAPTGTDYFRDCAAGKYKYSDFPGNRLEVWCDRDARWEYDYEGKWQDEA